MTSLALIITLSDSIHNLLDGVAIGLSTSFAVFCHEVPHEFGDFAVMLSTGMSIRRAAIINFLSAMTAFIGLYLGLILGTSEIANRWALSVCAGLFLYIALCDMLPELKEMSDQVFSKKWFISFGLKNFGIILGYSLMIFLALYEDQINFY
ncbi:zinc transporter ZIP4-like protein [Sarcoptes scabiei]|uniref:Zinc transporter ZIP4-like protein n=1 Tax=Sarcoptes scabiei TaxID=52283 RepID=A0A132ABQ1_SARSC|nr:zinc transporter ZIP4-like protein [Sarcoptes scabiei]